MLGDDRLAVKARERLGHAVSRRRGDGVGNRKAGAAQGGILHKFGNLEIQRRAPVEGAPPLCFQPGKDASGHFRSIAIAARVRGSAHPVVENALGRRLEPGKLAAPEIPVTVGDAAGIQRREQGRGPVRVFMDHMDGRSRKIG